MNDSTLIIIGLGVVFLLGNSKPAKTTEEKRADLIKYSDSHARFNENQKVELREAFNSMLDVDVDFMYNFIYNYVLKGRPFPRVLHEQLFAILQRYDASGFGI